MLLQERLDRLMLEIASMQRCVGERCYSPAVVPTSTFVSHGQGEILTSSNHSSLSVPLMMVSASLSKNPAITEESWEFEEKDSEGSGKGKSGEGKSISNFLNLSNSASAEGSCKMSLGSCESLADSEGSLGQPSRSRVALIKPFNPSPLKFFYEDDVFFA